MQSASKPSIDRYWLNNIPHLGPIMSGTKCNGDKPIFLLKDGSLWSIEHNNNEEDDDDEDEYDDNNNHHNDINGNDDDDNNNDDNGYDNDLYPYNSNSFKTNLTQIMQGY